MSSPSRGIALLSYPNYEVFPVLIQILSHLEPVANYALFGTGRRSSTPHGTPFHQAFDHLLEYIWKGNQDPLQQQQQLMERLVQTLKEAYPLPDNPDIMELFVTMVSLLMDANHELATVFCTERATVLTMCPACTFTNNPRTDMTSKHKVSTQQWKEFESTGILDTALIEDVDGYHCQVCGTTYTARKSDLISKPPEILVLELDRYFFNYETFTLQKSNTLFSLDVKTPLPFRYYTQEGSAIQLYDLVAVANHEGLGTSGVYSCCFWNTALHKWFCCHGNQLPTPFTHNLESFITPSNYVLFFTKKKPIQQKPSFLRQFGTMDISFSFSE
ncbi:hypothetical protein C9374_014049 [Naegleria lovaniensis]|uniref:USP domain-containing protein n=1 Tax=Naegleria lovaniensis TaxID=51637 RepID=A0AA88H0Y8_NAELO|nr:uncharacterized protein C9374_014049 [Naegleria lovaniensis]KAG2389489.1 hypothetical protein C9374_014049 [Naegleria lovaniensis]